MCNIKKNTYNQLSGLDPTWQFACSGSALGHVAMSAQFCVTWTRVWCHCGSIGLRIG